MSETKTFVENMQAALVRILTSTDGAELFADKVKFNTASVGVLLDLQNLLTQAQISQGTLIGMCFVALGAKPEDVEVSSVDPNTVAFYHKGVWVASMMSQRENVVHSGKSITLSTGLTFSADALTALDKAGGRVDPTETKKVDNVGAN